MVVFWLECGCPSAGRERKREVVAGRARENKERDV
jgi:hypothetical protein